MCYGESGGPSNIAGGRHREVEMGNELVPGALQLAGLASCLLLQRSETNVFLDSWAGDLGLLLELSWVGAPNITRGDSFVVVVISRGRVEEREREMRRDESIKQKLLRAHSISIRAIYR